MNINQHRISSKEIISYRAVHCLGLSKMNHMGEIHNILESKLPLFHHETRWNESQTFTNEKIIDYFHEKGTKSKLIKFKARQ